MAVSKHFLTRLKRAASTLPDVAALRGLDEVNWAALKHAHGKATDLPILLRAAVCDSPDARQLAFELLSETIWHQGTVYSATAPVVPFLYRLLEADVTPDKKEVALLLASLAGCQLGTLPDDLTGANEDVAATRQAVGKRLDLLYPFVRDPEWGVRHAVAWAFGRFPEVAIRLVSDLQAAYRRERNPSVRLALAWAIGQSPEAAAQLLPELENALKDAPDEWQRQALQGVIDRIRKCATGT